MSQQIKDVKKLCHAGYLSFKQQKFFSFDFVIGLFSLAFQAIIYFFLFSNMFASTRDISPLRLASYYVIVNFVSATISPARFIAYEHMQAINSGSIIMELMRPISAPIKKYVSCLFSTFLPMIVNLLFILGVQIFSLNKVTLSGLGFGTISTLLAFTILYLCQAIIGCLTIWFHDITRMRDVIYSLSMLLGGKLLPSSLLIGDLKKISYFTPFPYIYDVPTSFFLAELNYRRLLYQILWVIFLALIYLLLFKRFVSNNIDYGG